MKGAGLARSAASSLKRMLSMTASLRINWQSIAVANGMWVVVLEAFTTMASFSWSSDFYLISAGNRSV